MPERDADKAAGGNGKSSRRFRIALSFTGEKREFVSQVAEILARQFSKDKVLYDKYHTAEFADPSLGLKLPSLYGEESDLIVAIVCPDYDKKPWTGLEWERIYAQHMEHRDGRIMLCRFENATVKGLTKLAGFADLDDETPESTANLILERLAISEGRKRDFYIQAKSAGKRSRAWQDIDAGKSMPAPPAFHAEPDYMGSHEFVGRASELETIDEWADAADTHPVLLFEAIGGAGKSMLTWHWTKHHADRVRKDWAGQFWYSFYEHGAIMEDFARRAVAYLRHQPVESLRKIRMPDLSEELLRRLKAEPHLFILDGLERVLVAYHRIDAAQLADDAVDTAKDQMAKRDPCSAIRPEDDQFLRALAAAGQSKVLISTRLTPKALLNPSHVALPGVQHMRLKGLRPADAEGLLRAQGVSGNSEAIQRYLKTNCDCHPLVTGVLAGLINDYLPDRGNFDEWAADNGPLGGARLNLAELDLVQRKNHILKAAIEATPEKGRQLLSTLALLSQAVDYETLSAFNPHLPPEPAKVDVPRNPEESEFWKFMSDARKEKAIREYEEETTRRRAYQQAMQVRGESAALRNAPKQLVETVKDVERRGLLQYDTNTKRHDLHPVVRGVARGGLKHDETEQLGQLVVDYFSQKPHSPYEEAETFEDVAAGVEVVRTLIQMGKMDEAADVFKGELHSALLINLDADSDILSLVRPFFRGEWGELPDRVETVNASYLASCVGLCLTRIGSHSESMKACVASLHAFLELKHWQSVATCLAVLVHPLWHQNRLATLKRMYELRLVLGEALSDVDLFLARLSRFHFLSLLGEFDDARAIWNLLDPMGRNWPRRMYRKGDAEHSHILFQIFQGKLTEQELDMAERLVRDGRDRSLRRSLHRLRGAWSAERGEWALAKECLSNAVRMAREVGGVDAAAETLLALSNWHLNQLSHADARHEAERLASMDNPSHRHLAELWLAIDNHGQAVKHALAAHKWAWADGEPYVQRYELDKSIALLERLGEPVPNLPPYDSAKDPPFEWEADVWAAIEMLKKEKAEREAKEREAAAGDGEDS